MASITALYKDIGIVGKQNYIIDTKDKVLFIIICKLHPMGPELTTSPSTLLLQGKEMPFELELIGYKLHLISIQQNYTKDVNDNHESY